MLGTDKPVYKGHWMEPGFNLNHMLGTDKPVYKGHWMEPGFKRHWREPDNVTLCAVVLYLQVQLIYTHYSLNYETQFSFIDSDMLCIGAH